MGHARTLLSVESVEKQLLLANEIIEKMLSVRETERLVRELQTEEPDNARTRNKSTNRKDPNIVAAEQKLSKGLAAPARIKFLKEGGVIEIKFSSSEDLSRLFDQLMLRAL